MIRILLALVLAAIRIAGHHSQAYQAAAHLFVGGMIGSAITQYQTRHLEDFYKGGRRSEKSFTLNVVLVVVLSVIEVGCFLWFRFVT